VIRRIKVKTLITLVEGGGQYHRRHDRHPVVGLRQGPDDEDAGLFPHYGAAPTWRANRTELRYSPSEDT
jgi:hypothetical protein